MHTLTTQRVTVTPFEVVTKLNLQELKAALQAHPYERHEGRRGWGGIPLDPKGQTDQTNSLREIPGAPITSESSAWGGPVLRARLLYDYIDRQAASRFPDLAKEQSETVMALDAIDVLLQAHPGREDALRGFALTKSTEHFVSRFAPTFQDHIQASDVSALIRTNGAGLAPESDFYLWLIAKNGEEVATGLTVAFIRDMRAENVQHQRTRVLDSVDLDREEVMIFVKNPATEYGPAKFIVVDDGLDLEADIELAPDGTFALHATKSWYGSRDLALNTPLGRFTAVGELTMTLLPNLFRAHREDEAWHDGGREELQEQARSNLVAIL